jgi:RNA polymerase sigma-70 factor (ECF subfamily)
LAEVPLHPDGSGAARDHVADLVQRGYRFALCLTHHNAQAEDLVQDAWFAVLRAGKPFSREYLFATIRNRFIDLYRRSKVLGIEPLGEHVSPHADDPWAGDEPILVGNGRLEAAMARLRPEERAALYLSAVEGYTGRQIAELMDWPRGTVLSHIHRARIKLRRMLESEPG